MSAVRIETRPVDHFESYRKWHRVRGAAGNVEYAYLIDDHERHEGPVLHLVWREGIDPVTFKHLRETGGKVDWLSGCSFKTLLDSEQEFMAALPQPLATIIQRELFPYKMDLL